MGDENSSNSVDQSVIVIKSVEEAGNSNATVNGLGSSKESVGEREVRDLKDDDKHSCVIDVKSSGGGGGNGKLGENLDGERICRICHLSSDPETPPRPPTTTNVTVMMANTGLIELGCDCKDELGIVHTYCAEAWFKLKGNRYSVKFVVRRPKTLQVLGIPDSWKSGMKQELPVMLVTLPTGAEDVGGDSHFATS
ncbi:unnamed protein product [Camellia sinensis]